MCLCVYVCCVFVCVYLCLCTCTVHVCVLCVSMHVCACGCVYGMHVCICTLCLHVHVCLSVVYCVSQSITFTALVKRETTLMRREIDSVSAALVVPDCVVLFG